MAILMAMGVPVRVADPETGTADGVLDGVIGTSLSGAPSGLAEDLIRWANGQSAPVLALDAPSGLASTTGTAFAPSITATATLTPALPKVGLRHPQVGALILADISVPQALCLRSLAIAFDPVFAESDIVRLAWARGEPHPCQL